MIYLILISFFLILGLLILSQFPHSNIDIKISKKIQNLLVEVIWCYLGGWILLFIVKINESSQGNSFFQWYYLFEDRFFRNYIGEWFLGFFITAIFIWSIKFYNTRK
jgi:hypothetical protein